ALGPLLLSRRARLSGFRLRRLRLLLGGGGGGALLAAAAAATTAATLRLRRGGAFRRRRLSGSDFLPGSGRLCRDLLLRLLSLPQSKQGHSMSPLLVRAATSPPGWGRPSRC